MQIVSSTALAQKPTQNVELDISMGEDNNNNSNNMNMNMNMNNNMIMNNSKSGNENQFLNTKQDQALKGLTNNIYNVNNFYEYNNKAEDNTNLPQNSNSNNVSEFAEIDKPKRMIMATSSYKNVIKNRTPRKFWTWNMDGLTPRIASGLEEFCKQARLILPDIISIQEPRLECCPERGRSFASARCSKDLDFLRSRLPRYRFYCSFASKKYAGQILAVLEECSVPSVRYNLAPEAEEYTNKHNEEGRIIVAEFPDLRVVSVYVPHNSIADFERIKRRCIFDDSLRKFLFNQYRVSTKPVVLLGDLNAVHENEDFYIPSHYSTSSTESLTPSDVGFPGTTENERRRFRALLSEARLIDYGLYSNTTGTERWTWQGRGKFKEFYSRVDYILISEMLQQQNCVERYSVGGYYNSDHRVVELLLVMDWNLRLKEEQCSSNAIQRISLRCLKNIYKSAVSQNGNSGTMYPQVSNVVSTRRPKDTIMTLNAQRALADRCGHLLLGSDIELPCNALLDTGCSNANYMSSKFYDEHVALLEPYSSPTSGSVYFADRKQRQHFDTQVTAPLRFLDNQGWSHEAVLNFNVLVGEGRDVIVGLPSLIVDYGHLFASLVTKAVEEYGPPPREILQAIDSTSTPPEGCIYPWSTYNFDEAPEDLIVPEADSYSSIVHFLSTSYEEELKKFNDMLQDHVDKDFAAQTPVLELLQQYREVFVKKTWDGLNIAPINLTFRSDMPLRMKPNPRPIPPSLLENSEKEFKRMLTYFFEECDSPWASPLVVASKGSEPWIRLCINLQRVNKYIDFGHEPIPDVKQTLFKLSVCKYFLELDLRNSYHQIPITKTTGDRLSVQTPWGQYRPKFLPEGVSPGSHVLQRCVREIFSSLGEWCLCLFDNVLIGGESYRQCYERLALFLERAERYNVYLKFDKTYLGFKETKFFGYVVCNGTYRMGEDRCAALDLIKFPEGSQATCQTSMRSFLGQTRIFQPHVSDYTEYSAPLDAMTSKSFNWDESSWQMDYRAIFSRFKEKLKEAMTLFFPDYNLDWILRTDASVVGYGGVLYMVYVRDDGKKEYRPIKFMSKKFSDAATRWDTYSQECYAIFACVKECEYLLRGKPFIIETDHNNLQWMEKSAVPKIIRQYLYLRTYECWVRHVPGKSNTADYWSRLLQTISMVSDDIRNDEGIVIALLEDVSEGHPIDQDYWNDELLLKEMLCKLTLANEKSELNVSEIENNESRTPEDLFKLVHGGRMLHNGVRRTWLLLNKLFPSHKIPIKKIAEMIEECPVCQKFRLGMRDQLDPIPRVLKPKHHRHTIGIDNLSITPTSADGYKGIVTIVNHFTHLVYLYPTKEFDAHSIACAIMSYISNYALVDEIISDPGSDLMSKAVKEVNDWLGIRHKVSLVDVHTSNGCENTNRLVIQHLSTLVSDERLKDKWCDRLILSLIQFHLNSSLNAEIGVEPFKATFGSADSDYYKIDSKLSPEEFETSYVKLLDENLKIIREISKQYQDSLVNKRIPSGVKYNQFAVGDLVLKLVRTPTVHWKREKLGANFTGPWRVEYVYKNDYKCRHITQGIVQSFHVSMLKPYFGSEAEAHKAALLDYDQFVVIKIHAYVGDPRARKTMEFLVEYADGDKLWKLWDDDLFQCEAYEAYCKSVPELWSLIYTTEVARRERSLLNRTPITNMKEGDVFYVDLRAFGQSWYNGYGEGALNPPLPDEDTSVYVVKCEVLHWLNNSFTKIRLRCQLLDLNFDWNHDMIRCWAQYSSVASHHIEINEETLRKYPQIRESMKKSKMFQKRKQ